MEQQTYEREIDLILLAKEVLKKIKTIIITGIAGAVILGIIGMIVLIRDYNDPMVMDYQRAEYQDALNAYNVEINRLSREIENLKTSIERQTEYNEKSILMKINPYDVQNGVVQYYVDTDYKINTDSAYQNPDNTASVLNAYATNVNNGGLWKYLYDNMGEPVEFRYLQELVSVYVDYENHMINVSVKVRTEADCKELLSLVKKCFEGYHETINSAICEHDMLLITESVYATVELNLEDTQRLNAEKVTDYVATKEEREFELKELEKDGEPDNTVLTPLGIVIGTVKWMIIGGVLGVFATALVICMMLLLDTTIKNDKDVMFYLGLPVLSEIPVICGKEKETQLLKKRKKDRLNQYGGSSR